jgi:pimeloyl-ACP methyl ester carboxylesterase
MKRIADALPNSEFVLIPGTGHYMNVEAPDVHRRTITYFLHKVRR